MRKKRIIWAVAILAVLALLIGGRSVYVNSCYRADTDAIAAFNIEGGRYIDQRQGDNYESFIPDDPIAGLIFYPGGMVEPESYFPLMRAMAKQGVLCVLIDMPFDLAVFDVNAANGVIEQFPQVDRWYMGGHSLGGAMAASYVSKNEDYFRGLVLLAAYSTADLSDSDLHVISLYGSEDGVLNMEKYEKYRSNLPEDTAEDIIDGGCHAYFGMYGEQRGDGEAKITNEEQILYTAEAVYGMVAEHR